MNDIKPIETIYNGYRFRSRLEARWAVFFDAIGAQWEYEPEGFDLGNGEYYLPDFKLKSVEGRGAHGGDIWVEIKGVLSESDYRKIETFSRVNDESAWNEPVTINPIIIFGQIPDCKYIKPYWDVDIGKMRGGYWDIDYFKDGDESFYNLYFSERDWYNTQPKAKRGGGLILDYPDCPYDDLVDERKTVEAYTAARQARFEHGEKPVICHL